MLWGWEKGRCAWSCEVVGLNPVCVCGGGWSWVLAGSLEPISQPPLPQQHSAFFHLPCFLPQACSAVDLPALGRDAEGKRWAVAPGADSAGEKKPQMQGLGGGCSEPEKSQSHCLLLVPGLPVSPWGDESSPWCGQGLLPVEGGVLGTGLLVREANKQTWSRLDRGGSLELEAVQGCGENGPVVSSQVPCIC